jgi:peptidoglycan/xylan/chitin deacetylase (PgdA/CDA1 family)
MSALIKNSVFLASKYLGLFAISRWILRNKVRVLCYHGFTTLDEHLNVPGLFIQPNVFADRMNYLQRKGYKVIGLNEAYQDVSTGVKDNSRVVITIDDGFVSVLRKAAPILKQHNFPSTLYLTSYYFDKNCPVFTLAVGYLFWRTELSHADFSLLGVPALAEFKNCSLDTKNKYKIEIAVKEYGQPLNGNEKRVELLEKLGEILSVDYSQLNKDRFFNLVNKQELVELEQYGIDIQLHTHRHTFPVDQAIAEKEIADNKAFINPLLDKPMEHFCYPSGVWTERHWAALTQQGVLTATTCQIGLVDEKTPLFAWPRILDSSRVSQIEFEAEVSGFNELLRMARS